MKLHHGLIEHHDPCACPTHTLFTVTSGKHTLEPKRKVPKYVSRMDLRHLLPKPHFLEQSFLAFNHIYPLRAQLRVILVT